jgi:hypothetical protein
MYYKPLLMLALMLSLHSNEVKSIVIESRPEAVPVKVIWFY